jgi:hypothetical protein
MRELALVPLALLCCAASQPLRVGLDQVPPGAKCTESVVLKAFVGQPVSAQLGAQMMAAAQARHLRWVPANAPVRSAYDSKRLTVRIDGQNRVVSASCS